MLINVTDLLGDPDFIEPLTGYRITQTVGATGRAAQVEEVFYFSGSVQPDGGKQLDRTLDIARTSQMINVFTTEPLSMGTDTTQADEIEWQGQRWVVRTVEDYTQYGLGFVKAVCESKELVGANYGEQ